MSDSIDIIKMADDILASADFNDEFLEHHGVKGMHWGVITKDRGSGIGARFRRMFNPSERAAYRGYKEAYKKKRQAEKIAVQKAKIGNDLRKVNKNKHLYSQNEINQFLQRSNSENQLSKSINAQKEAKLQRKLEERAYRDAKKQQKFENKLAREEIKSKERIEKAKLQNQIDVQNAKDQAQAEREAAAREYQTQQEIAKGKTLLGRLQKGAKLTAAVMGIASNGKKIAEIFGFDTSKAEAATEKVKEVAEKVTGKSEKEKNQGVPVSVPSTPKPETKKGDANAPKSTFDFDPNKPREKSQKEIAKNKEHHDKAVKEWEDWQKSNAEKWEQKRKDTSTWLSAMDTQRDFQKQQSESEKKQHEETRKRMANDIFGLHTGVSTPGELVKDDAGNTSYLHGPKGIVTPAEKKEKPSFKSAGASVWEELQNSRKAKEAETKQQVEAAKDRAREIKENVREAKSAGVDNNTIRFVTSMSTSKLAEILAGVPGADMPDNVNTGVYARKNPATSFTDEYKNSKKMMRKQRYGNVKHDDIEETAGEVEDAE